jgi:hypothetical protein
VTLIQIVVYVIFYVRASGYKPVIELGKLWRATETVVKVGGINLQMGSRLVGEGGMVILLSPTPLPSIRAAFLREHTFTCYYTN